MGRYFLLSILILTASLLAAGTSSCVSILMERGDGMSPVDMDVGILTTMIGAPYFIWLLMAESRVKGFVCD